jgi:hypothetical protein
MAVTRDRSHGTSGQQEPHCGTEGELWVATIAMVTRDPATIWKDEPLKTPSTTSAAPSSACRRRIHGIDQNRANR